MNMMTRTLSTIATREGMMTGEQFEQWLETMKAEGLARSDAAAGRMLGVSVHTMMRLKRNGTDTRTALACRALIHRMEPYQ